MKPLMSFEEKSSQKVEILCALACRGSGFELAGLVAAITSSGARPTHQSRSLQVWAASSSQAKHLVRPISGDCPWEAPSLHHLVPMI